MLGVRSSLILILIASTVIKESIGNYELNIHAFDALYKNTTKFLNLDKVKVKRKSRKEQHKIYGEISFFESVDWDVDAKLLIYEKMGYEYRLSPFSLSKKYCWFIEKEDVVMPAFLDKIDLPKKCPIPVGTYHVKPEGFLPDVSKFPPVMFSGDYRFNITFFKDGEILQSASFYVNLQNKIGGRIGLK